MTQGRWLSIVAAAGVGIFALAFVQGWIVQEREVRGEGYRFLQISLNAWGGLAVPVTAAAAIGALGVGIVAAAKAAIGPRVPAAILLAGSGVVVGLIGASAWPIMQDGHASTVWLSVGWLLPVALVLSLAMFAGSIAVDRPSHRVITTAIALAVIVFIVGAAGRWMGLRLAEGTGQHWEAGSYTRQATDGEGTEVMVLTEESFRIGDRWAGTFESSGWTVVLDHDLACPDARGTYHAHRVDEEDLRFVMVVDTCSEGARAADLETGTWERDP